MALACVDLLFNSESWVLSDFSSLPSNAFFVRNSVVVLHIFCLWFASLLLTRKFSSMKLENSTVLHNAITPKLCRKNFRYLERIASLSSPDRSNIRCVWLLFIEAYSNRYKKTIATQRRVGFASLRLLEIPKVRFSSSRSRWPE